MKKYLLAFMAVICAFAFTTQNAENVIFDYYYSDDGSTWIGATSIGDAEDQTGCEENRTTFCANVYARHKLIMSGETVLGVAEDPNNPGNPYAPDAVLEWP